MNYNVKSIMKLIEYYKLKKVDHSRQYINFSCPFDTHVSVGCGINKHNGHWHCFSCAKSGSLFNFILQMEHNDAQRAKQIYNQFGFMGCNIDDEEFLKSINIILTDIKEEEAEEIIYLDKRLVNNYEKKYDYYIYRGLTKETCEYFNVRWSDKWQIRDRTR